MAELYPTFLLGFLWAINPDLMQSSWRPGLRDGPVFFFFFAKACALI